MTPTIREHNVTTGEIVDREMTEQELKTWEQEQKKHLEMVAALQLGREAKQKAKQSALDKLAALGLSVEEISAITGA